jgi:hypothetical protein
MKKTIQISLLMLCLACFTGCNANTKKQTETLALNSTPISKPSNQFIKVALLLDTSNSMDGLIDQAKAQLWDIVNELSYAKCDDAKPNLQIALYEYGNDRLNGDEGYIRQVLAFSDDLDEISKELFSLSTNGGNEYCGHVIQTSLNQLKWGDNPDDLKLIFIAGNEAFTQGSVNYKGASKQAHKSDISVNTIFCGDFNQGINAQWKDGADLTHGDYMAINHNHRTVHVASPYDDDLLHLNTRLNKTYLGYGSLGASKMNMQAEQDANAETYSKANAVKRTVSKSTHLYKNSKWDLVDAIETEEVIVEDISEDALPKELKNKTSQEKKQIIDSKSKERKQIQKDIQELNKKRATYIAKEQPKNALEKAMLNAIKKQAEKKNYKWEE